MELSTTVTKKGRINVLADGEYSFTVPAFIWYRSPLSSSLEAQPEELEALKAEGAYADAEDRALRLLSERAHSERELRTKLLRFCDPATADAVLSSLEGKGYLNDEAFAEGYAEELVRRRFYGPERVRAELLRKGISAALAEKTLESLDIDKNAGIINIIRKMHLPETLTKKEADRVVRRLLSAGYSISDVREALDFSPED